MTTTPLARRTGMSSHHSHRAGTTTWLTPLPIIDALGPFDLDPCAHPDWPTATRLITLPTDGLTAQWEPHERVWLNPPYGKAAWSWLHRLAQHPGGGIALVFARTETAGFVEQVWGKADGVTFIHGRLHFHHGDGTRAATNSGAPSALIAYGRWATQQLETDTRIDGTYLRLRANDRHPTPA